MAARASLEKLENCRKGVNELASHSGNSLRVVKTLKEAFHEFVSDEFLRDTENDPLPGTSYKMLDKLVTSESKENPAFKRDFDRILDEKSGATRAQELLGVAMKALNNVLNNSPKRSGKRQ